MMSNPLWLFGQIPVRQECTTFGTLSKRSVGLETSA
jgi:hypothetical protein